MLAITNGKLFTVANGVIENGTILIENGRIAAIGAGLGVPAGCEVLDAAGKWVTPGFIDAHTHISTFAEPQPRPVIHDGNESSSPNTSQIRGIDGLNPQDMAITEARKAEGWIFSDGYFTGTQSMAIAGGTPIKGFEDLKDHIVAVKGGTLSEEYANSLSEQYGFKVETFGSTLAVFMAVSGGQCAACFDDTPVIEDYIRSGGISLELVEGTANEGAEYGFVVFSADRQELMDKFNAGLANIRASGAYDEILAKYMGE